MRKWRRTTVIKLKQILLCGSIALATTAASAETYRFSSWNAPTEPTTQANDQFVKDLEAATNGKITFEHFTGGAIMPPKSHLQGIGDGVAQIGQTTVGYTPSDLPINASIAGFGFIEPDPIAIGAAFADWTMHDPAAQEEWRGHNVLPMAGFSTPEYSLMCNTSEPITEAAQMKGLKVRAYGLIGDLVKSLGGVPVGMPASEAYQALQTGALDCASLSANWLRDGNLQEVSNYTTLTRWTPAFNSPQMTINRDWWQGLTDEQRQTIFELAARTEARAHIKYAAAATSALDAALKAGQTEVAEPGASLQEAVKAWIDAGIGDMVGIARDTYGVSDPEAVFASFKPYVEKWGKLARGMKDRNNEDELTQLLLDNMFNDLDPAVYGMN
jgi:TRAP-type C4-dicarboxylate transport system substrate-binding protein